MKSIRVKKVYFLTTESTILASITNDKKWKKKEELHASFIVRYYISVLLHWMHLILTTFSPFWISVTTYKEKNISNKSIKLPNKSKVTETSKYRLQKLTEKNC